MLECNIVFPDQHVACVRASQTRMFLLLSLFLFPSARKNVCFQIVRKLELMGEDTCERWHRDFYCGRAIITYNLRGTEYTSEVGRR